MDMSEIFMFLRFVIFSQYDHIDALVIKRLHGHHTYLVFLKYMHKTLVEKNILLRFNACALYDHIGPDKGPEPLT